MTTTSDEPTAPLQPSPWLTREVRLWQPHNPAALLYVVLLALGAYSFVHRLLLPSVHLNSTVALGAVLLWGLYVLPWVVFIHHRELFAPLARRTAAVGFLWGGVIAVNLMAINANDANLGLLTKLFSPELASTWGASLTASWVEETSKGLGIIVVLLLVGGRLRSPFETMVLGAFVGLGFQVVEDWMYTVSSLSSTFGTDATYDVLSTFWARGIASGLWSHTMLSAVWGAGLGFIVARRPGRRVGIGLACIAAAMFMHFLWDSPIFADLGIYGVAAKAAIEITIFVVVYRLAVHRERDWVHDELAPEVDAGTITAEDLELLSDRYRRRRHHLRKVRHAHGKQAAHAERDFQRAVTELADAKYDAAGTETTEVRTWRAEVIASRADRDAALDDG